MLFTPVPLLPSPCPGRWAPSTFQANIGTIGVEQMPPAPDGETWILHGPPRETISNVQFIGRVPPLGRHRTKEVHCAILPHKPSNMAHRPMHPYRCLPAHQLPTLPPFFCPSFGVLNVNIREVVLFPPQGVKVGQGKQHGVHYSVHLYWPIAGLTIGVVLLEQVNYSLLVLSVI